MEKDLTDLDSALARFPIDLTPPWGPGWKTEIAVDLTDGPFLLFEADGRTLRARRSERVSDPLCSMRANTAQLLRLMRGESLVVLLFEGIKADRLSELFALQAVVVRARRNLANDVQDG